jgi:hypothetical protein
VLEIVATSSPISGEKALKKQRADFAVQTAGEVMKQRIHDTRSINRKSELTRHRKVLRERLRRKHMEAGSMPLDKMDTMEPSESVGNGAINAIWKLKQEEKESAHEKVCFWSDTQHARHYPYSKFRHVVKDFSTTSPQTLFATFSAMHSDMPLNTTIDHQKPLKDRKFIDKCSKAFHDRY